MSAQRPVLVFWAIAVALELLFAVLFLATGADAAITTGLQRAGLEFGTDFITAARVVAAYPAAAVGVALAIGQVAAPDLAVWLSSRIRRSSQLLGEVARRFRFWSSEVGWRRGVQTWVTAILVFTSCNLASALLHQTFIPTSLSWSLSWGMLPLLFVSMFLDAGAVLEENGWRGYALPALLQRHGPVVSSLVLGLLWASWHFPVKFNLFLDYPVRGAVVVLAAFTLKIVALTVVMTYFWAKAGQSTILAIAMHGLSNDVARIGGLTDPVTWQIEAITELDLAMPYIVVAIVVAVIARRHGWGDLRELSPIASGGRRGGTRRSRSPATPRRP